MDDYNSDDFEARVRSSFESQRLMTNLGAKIVTLARGEVWVEMPYNAAWTQQHGYIHAGIITSIVDSACGYAAYSMMPVGVGVLSVEYKINLLNPARGEKFVAKGKVVKAGRTLTVCSGEAFAYENDGEKLIAVMQATIMAVSL